MNLLRAVKTNSKVVSLILMFLLFGASGAAAQGAETDEWQFDLTLYAWATDLGGTVHQVGGVIPEGSFDIDVSDILDSLEMAFMGGFEARKNKWSIIADAVYLDVGDDKDTTLQTSLAGPVNASVGLDISAWILSGAVGYDMVQTDRGTLAIVGGVRYATVDVDANLDLMGQRRDRSESEDLVDGIIGVRGAINLNDNWYLPYYGDVGAGDSDLTWQMLAGVGYRFGWGDIKLVYRYLSYEMEDDAFLKDLDISGPALGVVFRF